MDNVPRHTESFIDCFSNINHLLIKEHHIKTCTIRRGIVRNSKLKYQKKLLKFVISRIDSNVKAKDIIQEGVIQNLFVFLVT